MEILGQRMWTMARRLVGRFFGIPSCGHHNAPRRISVFADRFEAKDGAVVVGSDFGVVIAVVKVAVG